MHVPDGFLNAPTSVVTGAVATGAVLLALRKSRDELDERTVPLAGLVAAFIFALQMINFPVGVGTSGHLMGGALAAVLVGPWTGLLCVSVVLIVQALLFADGGLSALGTNITLMAVVTVAVGWGVTKAVLAVLPKRSTSVPQAAFVGGLLSVPVAAGVFVLLYAAGGEVDLSFAALLATMVGWHVLIGIGEAFITAATVGAVVAVRPDLVFVARGQQPALRVRSAAGGLAPAPTAAPAPTHHRPRRGWVFTGLAGAALLLAGLVSFLASSKPDGLEFVAGEKGFLETARDHAFGGFALADYGEVGGIPVGLAGVLGVAIVVLVGSLLFKVVDGVRKTAIVDRTDERV